MFFSLLQAQYEGFRPLLSVRDQESTLSIANFKPLESVYEACRSVFYIFSSFAGYILWVVPVYKEMMWDICNHNLSLEDHITATLLLLIRL